MYIAKDNQDGSFSIFSPVDTTDINDNPITVLGQPYNVITVENLQSQIDDLSAQMAAIVAVQGGATPIQQYSNSQMAIKTKVAQ